MTRTNRLWAAAVGLVLLSGALGAGCIVDGQIARVLEEDPPSEPPPAEPATLEIVLPAGMDGGVVRLHAPGGEPLAYVGAVRGGVARFELPATETFENLILSVRQGQRVLLGLVPPVERLDSVFDPGRTIESAEVQGFTGNLNEMTTARVLVLLRAAELSPTMASLAGVHPRLLSESLLALGHPDNRGEALKKWEADFGRLYLLAEGDGDGPPIVDLETLTLSAAFLDSIDGGPAEPIENLGAAAAEVEFQSCYDPDRVRVVFVVEMRDGILDGACRPINRFVWALDEPESTMFLTGGVHEDYEGLSPEEQQATDELLGDWVPNVAPMYDDGTHGDAEAGDGYWTLAVDLPRREPALMLGYKYTWGTPGAGWTGTEEWPGNSRLLQLVDVNGDGLIVRLDRFGDEASNKDKANTHPEGVRLGVDWDTDLDGDGIPEAQESPEDLDRDAQCTPDGYPPVSSGPLLGDPDVEGGCFP